MTWLRFVNLALAVLTVLAPMAHALELPNKLRLDATLWLAVQQHLYQVWGPFLGAPTEIGALATSLGLAWMRRRSHGVLWPTLMAAAGYAGMIGCFFILNAPVNAAVSAWTAATRPPDWTTYRLYGESGHAIALLLSLVSPVALISASMKEKRF